MDWLLQLNRNRDPRDLKYHQFRDKAWRIYHKMSINEGLDEPSSESSLEEMVNETSESDSRENNSRSSDESYEDDNSGSSTEMIPWNRDLPRVLTRNNDRWNKGPWAHHNMWMYRPDDEEREREELSKSMNHLRKMAGLCPCGCGTEVFCPRFGGKK